MSMDGIINGYKLILDGVVEEDMEATAITNMESYQDSTIAEFINGKYLGWVPCNQLGCVGQPMRDYPMLLFRRKIEQ